jgi:hypothetical protein
LDSIGVKAFIWINEKNEKQVRYLIEKLAEVEGISKIDRDSIKDMAKAFE